MEKIISTESSSGSEMQENMFFSVTVTNASVVKERARIKSLTYTISNRERWEVMLLIISLLYVKPAIQDITKEP